MAIISQLVSIQRVTPIAITFEPLATPQFGIVVVIDQFRDPQVSLRVGRYGIRQIDQDVTLDISEISAGDQNGFAGLIARCIAIAMGYETAVSEQPHQLVELSSLFRRCSPNTDAHVFEIRFFRQPAGNAERVPPIGFNDIKIDSGQTGSAPAHQIFDHHRNGTAGRALGLAGFPRRTCDVDMRPAQTVRELAKIGRRD